MSKLIVAVFGLFISVFAWADASITYTSPVTGYKYGAEVLKPGGASDTGALRMTRRSLVVYDSGLVANNVEIDSGVSGIDLTGFSTCSIVVNNAAGAATRNLAWYEQLIDGTVIISYAQGVALGTISKFVAGTSMPNAVAGFVQATFPGAMPPRVRLRLFVASSGTGAGRVTMYCQ